MRVCGCVLYACFVGGAGESARSFGRISAAVSQTVYGGPGGAGTENERKVRDESPLYLSVFITKINICHVIPNLFDILLWNTRRNFDSWSFFFYVVTMNGD